MSLSVPGIISALSMKPMPAMLARSIANNFASMAAESAAAAENATETPAEAEPTAVAPSGQSAGPEGARALDQRA